MGETEVSEFNVFISHSHHDSEFCLRLVNALFQRIPSIDIFYDETTIRGGEMWMDRISSEVLARPIFIVVLSSKSVTAEWVRAETNIAINEGMANRGKRWIIPIRLERCEIKELAPWLSYYQIIDFAGDPEGPGLDKLVQTIHMTSQQPERIILESEDNGRNHDEQENARQLAANVHVSYKQGSYHHITVIGVPAIENQNNRYDAELWAEVGHSFLEVGRRDQNNVHSQEAINKALEILGTASKINSKRPDIWRWLAEAHSVTGDTDQAIKDWITALNWSDSPERILEIYADICSALHQAGRDTELSGYVNAAKEIVEVSSLEEQFKFGQHYWQQFSADSQVMPPDKQNRAEAFKALEEVIRDLGNAGRPRKFPSVVLGLQQRGIYHRKLGYGKFNEFIIDAEKHGLIRVVGPPEWGQIYLATEEVTLQPVRNPKSSSTPRVPKPPSQTDASKVAVIVDRLGKNQAYITVKSAVEFFKKSYSHLAGAAKEILNQWIADGDIVVYTTRPLFLDKSGQAQTFDDAIQINRDSARMQRLLQEAYASSPSSWKALDAETRAYLISTMKMLTDSLPYLTWNHLRTLLSKQDKETDWDMSIATAVDAGVIALRLVDIEDKAMRQLRTVRSLSLNTTNLEVAQTATQATIGSIESSGWQRARQSFAKLFNIG